MKAIVTVRLKSGVLDPQGKAILQAGRSLDFPGLKEIRVGKVFEVELEDMAPDKAKEIAKGLSEKLLANTVIEKFEVELLS